jgi:hypothetical protein
VIDRGIEAQFVLHKGTFLRTAGNPDRPRASELCQLTDQRSDGSARRCNDHGLVGLRLAYRP